MDRANETSRSYSSIVRANVLTVFNLILAAFGALTLIFGDARDALFLGIIVANSGIGITQEVRAKRALDRLSLLVAPRATVSRDGTARTVPVGEAQAALAALGASASVRNLTLKGDRGGVGADRRGRPARRHDPQHRGGAGRQDPERRAAAGDAQRRDSGAQRPSERRRPIRAASRRAAEESACAALVRLVEQAQAHRAPFVRMADRYAGVVKGTPAIEALGEARTVLFDKTGTLTVGTPDVRKALPADGLDEGELLRLAASVDRLSAHVLGAALACEAQDAGLVLSSARDVREVPGQGTCRRVWG